MSVTTLIIHYYECHYAHNSVVECYTSNVDTRVRFPLSVNSLVLLQKEPGGGQGIFPLVYRFSSVGSSVGLLEEDDSPMSRVRAPQSVSCIFFMKPIFEFIKI